MRPKEAAANLLSTALRARVGQRLPPISPEGARWEIDVSIGSGEDPDFRATLRLVRPLRRPETFIAVASDPFLALDEALDGAQAWLVNAGQISHAELPA